MLKQVQQSQGSPQYFEKCSCQLSDQYKRLIQKDRVAFVLKVRKRFRWPQNSRD